MASSSQDENRRRGKRVRVQQHAKILIGRGSAQKMLYCTVKDFSVAGARLEVPAAMELPDTFDLLIVTHEMRYFPAEIRWRNGGSLGVSLGPEQPWPPGSTFLHHLVTGSL